MLEADEMWSFVYERWNKRWVWTVMCRRTRQIVAFVIGDRSEAACNKLWEQIPSAYRTCQSYSDFWEAYQLVFPEETHECVGKGSGQTTPMERLRLCTKSLQGFLSFVITYHLLLNHYQIFMRQLRKIERGLKR